MRGQAQGENQAAKRIPHQSECRAVKVPWPMGSSKLDLWQEGKNRFGGYLFIRLRERDC